MSYNVPEEEKSTFNKKVKSSLELLSKDVGRTLGQLQIIQPESLADVVQEPIQKQDSVSLSASPSTQTIAEEVATPPQRDMVSITPYEQSVTDIVGEEVDSLRNDAGEIASSPLEVFAKPLDANKIKALGFVDGEGKPTERGQLFYNLQQAGMFNDDGAITEKGQAYLTPIEDLGKEENLKAFQILWDDEVIRPSATFSEIASNTGKFVVDAALGGAKRIGQEAQSFWYNSQTWDSALGQTDSRPQELRDKMTASGLGLVEGAVENLAGWAGIADVGSAWIGKKLYDILPAGMEEEAEQALYSARQRQWQTQQNIANLSTGEIAEAVLGMENATAEAESAKSRIGKEEFDKQYGQTSAFAQLALDPTNAVPASIAVKAARTAPLANRVAITAQKRMAKIAAQDLAIAEAQTAVEAANAVLKKEAATVNVANRLAADISTRAGANPELVARANQASQVASRITESANQIRSTLPTITAELDGLIAKRNSLATRIPEAYSQKVLQTMELGRQMRAMPAKAVGATLERVGDTISKTDTAITNYLQERGLDQMYTAAVGAAGVMGLAGSPVIGAIGAGAAALKTGKVLSNYGKLFRYVGKEMENVRGQIPFWKRVAAHTAPGSFGRGVAHTFNMLDLGGVTSDTIRRAGRGVAAAAPTDLMFEYLSDGADMRPETLYQAGAESFFIGGSFAAGGGAFMGTKKRMRELSIGDEINFRRDLTDSRQKALFEAIPAGTRRAIATYSIANPTLNYIFKDSGASRYDPNTNTAIINVKSTNPIKALVAHETLHHTIIKNNMENGISALFLGDTKNNTVGGLFRSRDGKLDPNFEAFRDGYYKRLGIDGMSNAERDAIYPLDKIAVEYFIEKHADQYAAMAESGELGAVASSGAARRKLGSILETVLPRIPVLKDLHFKSGGMIDANGAWVTGNGILDAEGVKRDPITSKMFREMNRRSAGLVPGQFDPLMSDKQDSGAPLILNPADGIDAELLHPLVKVDDTGKPIMQDGKPVALDRATELERALAGLTAKEVLQRKRDENYAPEKGEAHIDDEGQFQPGWLSNDVLTEMFAKNKYNPEQKRIIREMNKLIRKGAGDRVVMINFPATTRNKAGKVVYKPQAATLRDTVPVAVTISKDGNLLFGLMSVTKLHENIQKRSQSKRGKKLYGGNVDLILRDTQAMMDYHKQGVDSLEYFSQKYGAVEADQRKKFINTMFGLLNQKEQAVLNPMLLEDGVKSRDNVYRTYRADRVSKAVPMSPEEYPAMPFSYEAVSAVRMPEQRQMPEAEAPAPSQTRFMPEGVDEDKFYSQLERVITDKVPSRATPQQIMATIDPTRGSGVKADEIKWSGIEQALASLEKDGKVSKEDLLNYLRNEGRVRFEEVDVGKAYTPQDLEKMRKEAEQSGDFSRYDEALLQNLHDGTKYSQYQLPGGENYREVVLAIPQYGAEEPLSFSYSSLAGGMRMATSNRGGAGMGATDQAALADWKSQYGEKIKGSQKPLINTYTSSHFRDIPNYVAHMRTNERVDADGRPGLFVEEFQSDRHQEGRKKGYKEDVKIDESRIIGQNGSFRIRGVYDPSIKFNTRDKAVEYLTSITKQGTTGRVADAPFRTTWPLQLFKRALRDAVDSGKEWVGWTTGSTQSDRFDLSKRLSRISYEPNDDGTFDFEAYPLDDNLNPVISETNIDVNRIEELAGKEIAEKVVAKEGRKDTEGYRDWHHLEGLDLKTESKGMKGFYDDILPKEIGKYVKLFGGKVEKSQIGQSISREDLDMGDMSDATPEELAQLEAQGRVEGKAVPIWKVSITPEMRQLAQGQMRFLPEPVEKLSAFKGKRVQVLTSDLSLVGDVKYGNYTVSFKGGPGYLDNDGWAFTDKAAADAFVTRWKKDGEPLIGLASLGSANHLNSLDARKAYAEKWKYLVSTGEISEELATSHIKKAMKRIIDSESKNVKADWRNAAKMIENVDDLSNYFDKIPWAAAPMFYSKLTAKTLPIKYKTLVELGLDLNSVAKEYRQPEFEGAELGDLYAIAEYDGSNPEYKPELNKAYPWRIKFKKKATLSEMHNVAKLTTDPRAFAKKKVGGRLGAQPLMVTGINLDKLMTGDIAGSAKPLILREGTQKTKSNRATQFGSGNPEAYRSYQQIQAERNAKKPKKKSKSKGNSSAIANAAKLK